MKYVLSTNGSFTIINEARSSVLLASLKASETSKFWLKSSVLAGIVTSKVFEASQVLAEGIEYSF